MKHFEYLTAMQEHASFCPSALLAAYEQKNEDPRSDAAGMSQEPLRTRPISGKWSTLEVVGRVAGTAIYLADRIERTIALERPLFMGGEMNQP